MAPRASTAATRKSKADQAIIELATKTAKKVATKTANQVALQPNYDESFHEEENSEENDDYDFDLSSEVDEVDEVDTDTTTNFNAHAKNPPVIDERDVFEIGNEAMKNEGMAIKYHIKCNGQIAGVETAPFSMEDLQAKYGGGTFMVQAKRVSNGTFVKQQSFSVAAPLKNKAEEAKAESALGVDKLMNSFQAMMESTQQNAVQTQETLAQAMREQIEATEKRRIADQERDEKRIQEEKERMKTEATGNQAILLTLMQTLAAPKPTNDNMSTFLTLIQSQQQQQAQAQQQTLTMFMNGLEKISDNTNRMFEKITEKQERDTQEMYRRLEDISKKNAVKEQDPLALFKLLKDTSKDAIDEFRMMRELAREEAEDAKAPTEPKSLTDKIIENLAPMIMAGAQLRGAGAAPAAPVAFNPPETTQVAVQRAPQAQAPRTAPTVAKRVVVAQPAGKVVPAAAPVAAAPVKRAVTVQPVQNTQPAQNVVESNPEASKISNSVELKEKIIKFAADQLGAGILSAQTATPISAKECARLVSEGLLAGNVATIQAVQLISFADVEHEAYVVAGLPTGIPLLETYLKEFYESLVEIANQESRDATNG